MRTATGQSEPDVTKIRELEERLDNFRIQVADDMTIRGSAWTGYAHNVTSCEATEAVSPSTGACCLPDGTCEEVTVAQCIEDGGTFVGGLCIDADCPQPTGACCVGTDCTIETEDDCTGMGGTYQGDDTTCDPNPCECICEHLTDCGTLCGTTVVHEFTQSSSGDDSRFDCHFEASYDRTDTTTYDPETCFFIENVCDGGSWSIIASGDGCSCSSGNDSCVASPSTECAWDVLFGGAVTLDTTTCTGNTVHRHIEGVSASPIVGTWTSDEITTYS